MYNFIIIIDNAFICVRSVILLLLVKLGDENELKEPRDEKPKIKVKHVTFF